MSPAAAIASRSATACSRADDEVVREHGGGARCRGDLFGVTSGDRSRPSRTSSPGRSHHVRRPVCIAGERSSGRFTDWARLACYAPATDRRGCPINPFRIEGVWLKAQFHAHSLRSDGELEPEEIATRYRDLGYDVLTISDHWTMTKIDAPMGSCSFPAPS